MYNSINYGTVIKELRNNHYLSQQELAEDVCSQGMLSRIENNEVVPNVLVMQGLCDKLNVTINYVLTHNSEKKVKKSNWFRLLKNYKQSEQFEKLEKVIEKIESEDEIVFGSKVEQQEFLYYKGATSFKLNSNLEQSLNELQKGLNLTYSRNTIEASDLEVMLLSEIGKVYYSKGKKELGLSFLKNSITKFYGDTPHRERIELIKVFYNIASVLIDMKIYDEAMTYIEQGILWSQEKKSFYKLADLYLLKAIIFQDFNRVDDASEIAEIAKTLKSISSAS